MCKCVAIQRHLNMPLSLLQMKQGYREETQPECEGTGETERKIERDGEWEDDSETGMRCYELKSRTEQKEQRNKRETSSVC